MSQSLEGRPSSLLPQHRPWGSKSSVNICLIEFGQGATSRQSQGGGTQSPGLGSHLGTKKPVRGWAASPSQSDFAYQAGSSILRRGLQGTLVSHCLLILVTENPSSRPRQIPAIITHRGSAPPSKQSPLRSPAGSRAPALRPSHPSPQTPPPPFKVKNIETGTYHKRGGSILISCSKCLQGTCSLQER